MGTPPRMSAPKIVRSGSESRLGSREALQLGPRQILLGAIVLLAACAYRSLAGWDPGRTLASESPTLFVPSNTAPLFIFGLSALFVYLRLGRLGLAWRRSRPSFWGWPLLALALVVYLWAIHTEANDLLLLSFIPAALGGSLVLVGPPFTRVLLLPILFLIFAYPIPAVLANQQIYAFQTGTAQLTTWALGLIGQPAILEGDLIYTRGYVFEVIETCGGLRITETLVASAFAYAELSRMPRLHTMILVLLAPIIGFALNSVRVLLIIFHPTGDPASDHTLQGLVAIVVGVFCLALVDRLLMKLILPKAGAERAAHPAPAPAGAAGSRAREMSGAWGTLALVAGMACASIWLPRWQPATPARWEIALPVQWEGWRARGQDLDENFLGSVAFSRYVYRRYEKDDQQVDAFMAKDDRLQRDRSILSPKTVLPGAGWAIEERRTLQPDWAPVEVEEIVARRRSHRALIYHWREGSRGIPREALRSLLALDTSGLRKSGELRVFRVSTMLSDGEEGLGEARWRLEKFAPTVRESIRAS
jgi:EpsI family protein